MKRKTLIYGFVILAAIAAWAAFRPERIFVNAKVNETMPTATTTDSAGKYSHRAVSTALPTIARETQASISWPMGNGFSASPISKLLMDLTCTYISWPPTMRATATP